MPSPWKLLIRSGLLPAAATLALAVSCAGTDLYVALHGRDGWPGTREQPFATLERARDAIREARVAGALGPSGVTVWVGGGTYVRDRTFSLTAEDSGTEGGKVVYRPLDGEVPRFLGGRVVAEFAPVTDASVLRRLGARARRYVRQAALKAQGITDYGELLPRSYGRPVRPAALELFFRGSPMIPARWPNREFAAVEAVPGAGGLRDTRTATLGPPEAGFHYSGGRPSRWREHGDIWVHGYWAYDWADSHEKVASIDLAQKLVKISTPDIPFGFRPGQRFYFLNVLDELDEPGEWYLDRTAGLLYFWPPSPIGNGDVLVSLLTEPLVTLDYTAHTELRGLTFEAGRGTAVIVTGGFRSTITACTIRNMGQSGVIVWGGSGVGVRDCDISHTGEVAVSVIAGDRRTLVPAGVEVSGNTIHGFGRWCRSYQPAVRLGGVGNRLANNRLLFGPHSAVHLEGNDHVVEFNAISDVCTETGDAGALYMGRDWTARGNVVRYNNFHDIRGVGLGACAIYLDDLASGTTVFGNLVYNANRGLIMGGGRDNVVENNVFVDCRPAVTLDDRGLTEAFRELVSGEMRRSLEEANPRQPPYSVRYPRLADLDAYYASGRGIPPAGNSILRNIVLGGEWLRLITTAQDTSSYADVMGNYVDPDPHPVDRSVLEALQAPGAPAVELGFSPIPYDRIGPPAKAVDAPVPE